jgi:hypothetical protein
MPFIVADFDQILNPGEHVERHLEGCDILVLGPLPVNYELEKVTNGHLDVIRLHLQE